MGHSSSLWLNRLDLTTSIILGMPISAALSGLSDISRQTTLYIIENVCKQSVKDYLKDETILNITFCVECNP